MPCTTQQQSGVPYITPPVPHPSIPHRSIPQPSPLPSTPTDRGGVTAYLIAAPFATECRMPSWLQRG